MTKFSVAEAKAKLSEIIARVEAGEPQIITRRGKAVVKIIPADHETALFRTVDIESLRLLQSKLIASGAPVVDSDQFWKDVNAEERY